MDFGLDKKKLLEKCYLYDNLRLAKRYQSPLELRQRNRNHSTVSSLSSTPIKSSKDIVNSEQVKELTVNEIGKSSNENPTKSTIAKPNPKGRKRKVSDPRDEDGNTTDQVSSDNIEDIVQRPPKKLKF